MPLTLHAQRKERWPRASRRHFTGCARLAGDGRRSARCAALADTDQRVMVGARDLHSAPLFHNRIHKHLLFWSRSLVHWGLLSALVT